MQPYPVCKINQKYHKKIYFTALVFPPILGFLNGVALVAFKLSLTDILCIFTSTMSSLKAELLATKKSILSFAE